MKFKSIQDAQMFLIEVGRMDLLLSVDEKFTADADLCEDYIKGRSAFSNHLKSFRRIQSAKQSWRKNRRKYMSGIKRFHDSTPGKKFHRTLGRFLATRELKSGMYKREPNEDLPFELLAAISSARTHAYLEKAYYIPLSEAIEYDVFIDEFAPATHRIEMAIYKGGVINQDDLDILACAVEDKALCHELSEATELPYEEIIAYWNELKIKEGECFLAILTHLKKTLGERIESKQSEVNG